jgi:hypothetical protein
MQALLKSGESIKIDKETAKYSDLLTQLIEDEDFFHLGLNEDAPPSTGQQILKLELNNRDYNDYTKFCERINDHLKTSGYTIFKANHFFAEEYFKGSSDSELMNYFKIAEYLHCDVLRECLNWYLGGLFRDMDLNEIENMYLG